MASRERDDEIDIDVGRTIGDRDHGTVWHAGHGDDCALDVGGIVLDATGDRLDSERWRGGLGCMQQVIVIGGSFWISQKRHAFSLWCDLLEHLQPLAYDARLVSH